jgi:ABC-type multidrug transport system fused ATPase/permease subunit
MQSTTLSLLLRYYDIQEGSITIDGHDVRTLHPRWLRTHIAIVSQEPVLFSGTIRENILYSLTAKGTTKNATQGKLEHAATLANAHEFITGFPDGTLGSNTN